jgi:hypothetical protein
MELLCGAVRQANALVCLMVGLPCLETTCPNRSSTVGPGTAGARLEAAGPPSEWTRVLERNPRGHEPGAAPGLSGSTPPGRSCMLRQRGWSSGTIHRHDRAQLMRMSLGGYTSS